jgi:protein-S-isoprenylcysteine O-methyltransferase Ste14
MNFLNNRIPPPAVALVLAICMYALKEFGPQIHIGRDFRNFATLMLVVLGLACEVPAIFTFWKQKTTVNPLKIDSAKHLVVSGAYRFTRNPMYLGMSFLLIGWALNLANLLAFIGPILFVIYITRFQILLEERVLSKIFGNEYTEYKNKVRRWI